MKMWVCFLHILLRAGVGCVKKVLAFLKNRPAFDMTNPRRIEMIARKNGFQMEYAKSMYYGYRYHAILSKIP